MTSSFREKQIIVAMAQDEWEMVLNALRPYKHNDQYRGLLERLEQQSGTSRQPQFVRA